MPHESDPSQNGSTQQPTAEEQLGNMVNAAVKAHLQRFTEKQLPTLLEAALKPISEKLAAAPPPPPVDDEGKSKKSKQDPETNALAKQIEEMKKELADRDAKVAAAEKRAREERAYTELRGSLEGKVRPELIDMVAKHLMVVDQRVDFDESGVALFKSQRVPYAGAEPEELRLPLRAGVEDFLKSDAAKPFLPAPSGSGAAPLPKRGAAPVGGTDFSKPATTDAEKSRRAAERVRMAEAALKQQQ